MPSNSPPTSSETQERHVTALRGLCQAWRSVCDWGESHEMNVPTNGFVMRRSGPGGDGGDAISTLDTDGRSSWPRESPLPARPQPTPITPPPVSRATQPLTWSVGMVSRFDNESTDHIKDTAPVPWWVKSEPRRRG